MKVLVQSALLSLHTYFCECRLTVEERIHLEGEASHYREGNHPSFHFRQERNCSVELNELLNLFLVHQ